MGFSLTQDIFGPGATEQRWFKDFPVQVALLFRPGDQEFSEAVRRSFVDLSESTGRHVVFFTPLNPPSHWRPLAPGGQAEETRTDPALSLDEPVLVYELARRFGVAWDALPVLIVSTNLWSQGFVVAATGADHFIGQFRALTRLAGRGFLPPKEAVHHLEQLLEVLRPTSRDGYAALQPPHVSPQIEEDDTLATELQAAARESSLAPVILRQLEDVIEGVDQTGQHLRQARGQFDRCLDLLHSTSPVTPPEALAELRRLAEAARAVSTEIGRAEVAAGSLIAPLQVSLRRYRAAVTSQAESADKRRSWLDLHIAPLQWLNRLLGWSARTSLLFGGAIRVGRHFSVAEAPWGNDGFDEEGRILLTSAACTFQALRQVEGSAGHAVDFSSALLGIHKAVERQINLSLVQAARKSRDIAMPTYFCRWAPDCPPARSVVETGTDELGQTHRVDLNERRPDRPDRHRFLGFGDALHVVRVLNDRPASRLAIEFRAALGRDLPEELVPQLHAVRRVRNQAAHESVLSREECLRFASQALSPAVIGPLRSLTAALAPPS